jgi:putative ABC transport system ATP-binding protein
VLELSELVKHYPAGDQEEPIRAVDGVSLTIARGELVALYGPSGSGKTTLLELIAVLLRPDSGRVVVDGREVSALSGGEAARYRLNDLGYVGQSFEDFLPGGSLLQNAATKLLITGMRVGEAHRRVEPLLRDLGLGERLKHRPGEVSMGERQRVAIVRALSTEPKLLLADEPTGHLDTRRGGEVLDLLAEMCRERGTAALLVTHDPQATRVADRVHSLRDGKIVEFDLDEVFTPLRRRQE